MIGRISGAAAWLTVGLTLAGCASGTRAASSGTSGASPAYAPPEYTSGRFTVAMGEGRAWLITPTGEQFVSMGVNAINDGSYRAPNRHFYDPVNLQFGGDIAAWRSSVFSRLQAWGFNTVGAWANYALYQQRYPYTFILYAAGFDQPLEHVFEPQFAATVAANLAAAPNLKDDPYLIGYFLDNELPWWGELGFRAGGQKTLLEKYAHAEVGGSGKRVTREFLERRYEKDLARLNAAYHTSFKSFDDLEQSVDLPVRSRAAKADADAFTGLVAERFFSVTTKAVRAMDPSHLLLGVRFAGEAPWPVVEALGKYSDVVSVNQYQRTGDVNRALLDAFYAKTKKPILLSEYSFSATENQSGDPNTKGANVLVPTQRERAEHATRFATQALALPYVVGLHWFQWADESPEGRFDGEDQNYGLVDLQDRPYTRLTDAERTLNISAERLHSRASSPLPTHFQEAPGPTLHPALTGRAFPATLPFFSAEARTNIAEWGDASSGGSSHAEAGNGPVLVRFQTGAGWGTGVSLSPAQAPFDASGAGHVKAVLEFPAGVSLQLYLSEVGVAAPGLSKYQGAAGSDGESYEFPALIGTGKRETYVVDLHELERRTAYGNQNGNQVLDLQALATVDLYLPGKQGSGELRVSSVSFER